MHQYATLEDTVYFGFGANLTTGAAGDGASPVFDVRLGGAAAGAAPTLSGTPTLLTSANYTDGCYEVAVAATAANGFAANNTYLVFVSLTIDSVTPAACIGSFRLAPVPANVTQIGGDTQSATDLKDFADAGYDPATNKVQGVVLTDTVTTLTNLPAITANWLTAAGTAADFTTEIQTGLATAAALATVDTNVSAILVDTAEIGVAGAGLTNINLPNQTMDIVGNITGNLSGSVGSVTGAVGSVTGAVGSVTGLTNATIADQVWDEALAGHLGVGSTGEALNAAGAAGDPWTTTLPGAYGAGSAGFIIGNNIDAPISTVDTVVDAIKAKTDSLTFTVAGQVDANIQSINDVTIVGDGSGTPFNV